MARKIIFCQPASLVTTMLTPRSVGPSLSDPAATVRFMVGNPVGGAMPSRLDVLRFRPMVLPNRRATDPLFRLLDERAEAAAPALTRADVLDRYAPDPDRPLDGYAAALADFRAFLESQPTATAAGLLRQLELLGPGDVTVPTVPRLAFALDVLATHLTALLPSRAAMRAARTTQLRAGYALALRLKAEREHARRATAAESPHPRRPDHAAERLAPEAVVLASAPRHAPPASGRVARATA